MNQFINEEEDLEEAGLPVTPVAGSTSLNMNKKEAEDEDEDTNEQVENLYNELSERTIYDDWWREFSK